MKTTTPPASRPSRAGADPVPRPGPAPETQGTGRWRTAARSRPALAYVVLAIGLSWLVWIPAFRAAPETEALVFLGAFGPAVAGAIMVRAHGGRIRDWLRGMAVFRVRLRWYAVALALPLVDPAVQAVLAARAGAGLDLGALPARLPMIAGMFVMMLLLGGGQEEPGWRGWLLPRLQSGGTSPLVASLLVGIVWAVWHLPLYVWGPYDDLSFALYVPLVVAVSVVFTWLYNTTGGSVVLAMLLHAQVNTAKAWLPVADIAAFDTASASYQAAAQTTLALAYVAVAVVLVAVSGTRLGAGRPRAGRTPVR